MPYFTYAKESPPWPVVEPQPSSLSSSEDYPERRTIEPFRFVDLPPEIRNDIYSYDLERQGPIQITPEGFECPALLQACKQTRTEGLGIFYLENAFTMTESDSNTETLLRWEDHLVRLDFQPDEIKLYADLSISQIPSWTSFLPWLRRIQGRKSYVRCLDLKKHQVEDSSLESFTKFLPALLMVVLTHIKEAPWSVVEAWLEKRKAQMAINRGDWWRTEDFFEVDDFC